MFAEMLSNSNEKIFLEAIDQFFEQESPIDYVENEDSYTSDIEIEKMNDKFCDSLDEEDDNDCRINMSNTNKNISIEYDSEEIYSQNNYLPPKKKLFMNDFLIINQENIYKTKNQLLNDYYSRLKIIENYKNIWR